MSTQLRNVPDCEAQNKLTQTRFWGGENRMQCLQSAMLAGYTDQTQE